MGKDKVQQTTNKAEIGTISLIALYILAFAFIIISPIVAGKISPMFDYVSYGQMREYITQLFTLLLWVVEIIALRIFCQKKWKINILSNPKTKGQELSRKKIIVLSLISIGCILGISAQIGFEVKPFYDLGVKFTGYQLMANIGKYLTNIVKCAWIVLMIRSSQTVVERLIGKGKSKIIYGGIIVLLTVGIYDLCMGLTTLPVTYLFLNLVYGWIYLLTDRSTSKTYLLILLIYFF